MWAVPGFRLRNAPKHRSGATVPILVFRRIVAAETRLQLLKRRMAMYRQTVSGATLETTRETRVPPHHTPICF